MQAHDAVNARGRRFLQAAGAALAGLALGTSPLAARQLRRSLGLGS